MRYLTRMERFADAVTAIWIGGSACAVILYVGGSVHLHRVLLLDAVIGNPRLLLCIPAWGVVMMMIVLLDSMAMRAKERRVRNVLPLRDENRKSDGIVLVEDLPEESPFWVAGVRDGDQVLRANDERVEGYSDVCGAVARALYEREEIRLLLLRDGEQPGSERLVRVAADFRKSRSE
ncbi:MAG: hypothetical protein KGI60_03825 [Patescibacteria group bacterium]|nr:hypothetical protein [Patescibacteria group bacterium]